MRASEFITEVFEPGKKNWEWLRRGSEEATAQFKVGDREYRWDAFTQRANSTKWEVQFRLVRQRTDPDGLDLFGKTGTGNSAEVLSTAVDITRAFIQEYGLDKVEEITFNAKEDSRIGLYAKMIKRLLPNWDLYQKYSKDRGMEYHLTDRRAYDKPENKLSEEAKAVKYNGLILKYAFNDSALILKAFSKEGPIAYVKFVKENKELYPQDLWVNDDYRNKGIAKSMYDYLKSAGYVINRSHDQTKAGTGFWDKHRGEDAYVWEDVSRRGFLKGLAGAGLAASGIAKAGQFTPLEKLGNDPNAIENIWKPRATELEARCYKILDLFKNTIRDSNPEWATVIDNIKMKITIGDSRFQGAKADYGNRPGTHGVPKGVPYGQIILDTTVFWDAPNNIVAWILGHEAGHIIQLHDSSDNASWQKKRDNEHEADIIGATLAKRIGYNKAEFYKFFFNQKIEFTRNADPTHYHPEPRERAKVLKKYDFELSKNAVDYIDSMAHQLKQGLAEEVIDEMPLPADWDPAQMRQQATTFKSRLAYALERAKKLGTGSSRVATTIEYEGRPTVLKIAKNAKGLAQNSVEADILSDGYASQLGILIPLIDYDEQNREPSWIHTELAQKASEKQLCAMLGCENLSQLINIAWAITGKKKYLGTYQQYVDHLQQKGKSEQEIETCTDYANKLAELNSSFDVELADFARAANWGIYNGKPVILDVGFNSNVLNQYYKR